MTSHQTSFKTCFVIIRVHLTRFSTYPVQDTKFPIESCLPNLPNIHLSYTDLLFIHDRCL